ncbi:unnamed protein product [Penicillium salamii]|uniref:Uncharacterized protein n=1 Tax=Penicillium salamii TaxID=1612424 RepID=A0A9W4JV50_9EURO|nr:unnamed protein product [Penicillium salamii]CAG8397319.1 unnamed protein product [Penicillium salamii]CAG8416478.1 unnamed protein product [Penicillium salamii]
MLIGLVFLYALCVLGVSKWKMRRYAATEAKEQEVEAEIFPMLHKDDIPFGARALESGIEIEGIWNSNPNTPVPSPHQPSTPVRSRPSSLSPKSLPRDPETFSTSTDSQSPLISPKAVLPANQRGNAPEANLPLIHKAQRPSNLNPRGNLPAKRKRLPKSILVSPAREEALVGVKDPVVKERRVSFHSRVFPPPQRPEVVDYPVGSDGTQDESGFIAAMMGVDPHSSPKQKRASRLTSKLARYNSMTERETNKHCLCTEGLRRRSSEEFRRKMSQIFNDNMALEVSSEQLEFNPALREYSKRNFRKSLLRPLRPWFNHAGNDSAEEKVEQPLS